MTRDELTRLLEGTADVEERERLTQALAAPSDETHATLERGWAPPTGPNVFEAAFETVHPPAPPWWRRWAWPLSLAAALAIAGVVTLRPTSNAADGVKGAQATPTLGLVLVALDGAPRRLAGGDAVKVGSRVGARVTLSQPAWLALEELRPDGWSRLWPDDARGAWFEAGEHELADTAGAIVLRVGARTEPWALRLIGSSLALDTDGARSSLTTSVVVTP